MPEDEEQDKESGGKVEVRRSSGKTIDIYLGRLYH